MRVRFLHSTLSDDAQILIDEARIELARQGLPVDSCDTDPDGLVFLTGGTEQLAMSLVRDGIVLLPFGTRNGLASAVETAAWARHQGINAVLIAEPLINSNLLRAVRVLAELRGKTVGLVGGTSPWLIRGSDPTALKELGVLIDEVPIDALLPLVDFAERELPPYLAHCDMGNVDHHDLKQALAVYSSIKTLAAQRGWAGFSIACFDLLAKHRVSACLALALLAAEGLVVSCEGDLEALASQLLVEALIGLDGFMANIAWCGNDQAVFAHCTIPLSLAEHVKLTTHFESASSVGIQAHLTATEYTVFRMGAGRTFTLFESESLPHEHSSFMCRTQVAVRIPQGFFDFVLGNHHVLIPGLHAQALRTLAGLGWCEVSQRGS